MIKVSTSILSSKDRIESIKKLNTTTTDYIHIDAMDNIFVPNYQLPVEETNKLANYSNKKFDIHLMVEDPLNYINKLNCKNIINNITFHIEINKDIDDIINVIKKEGYGVGIAIKPNTNIDTLNKYLDKIDIVLIMSVEPGFGGQKFKKETINKIIYLRNKKPDILIEIDGGIDNEISNDIRLISDVLVSGSYIINSDNYQKAINDLKN